MSWISTADSLLGKLDGTSSLASSAGDQGFTLEDETILERALTRLGVLRKIQDIEILPGTSPLFGSIILTGGQDPTGHFLPARICGGSGFSRAQARLRAYGETLEHYCAGFYREADLRLDSYRNLREEAVHPDSFALFSAEQYASPGFEYRPFLEETRINWVQGYSLMRQKPVFVPAAFVYLPYWPVGGETPIGLFSSTGLASGRSLMEASLRGLLEVIERDAIMLMWLNRVAARCIDPQSYGNSRITGLAGAVETANIKVFDITSDVRIPTRFALLTEAYRGRSLVSCGAATRWDAQAATEKALIEALVVRKAVQKIIRTHPPRNYGSDYRKVREIADHLNFYTNPETLPLLNFLSGMEESPESDISLRKGEPSNQLKSGLGLLADLNLEAIVVDVTRPELAETGWRTVRVLVPGMLPLSFGSGHAPLAARRLRDVPRALGYDLPDGPQRFNPAPHPFA